VPFFVSEKLIKHLVSSNPSKAYVRRVAKIFKNNGHGVRGDLGAVVKAILMDDEAYFNRKEKAKEPLIAFTQMARVLQARPFSTADDHWAYRSDDTWGKGGIENRKKDKVFTDAYWLPNIKSSLGYAPMRSPSVFNFFKANFEPVVSDKDLPYSGNTHLNSQVFPELDPQTDQFFAKFSNALAHLLFQREVVGLQDEYLSRINDDLDDQNTTASSRRPNTYHANGLLVNISEPLKAMEMALENDDNLDFSTLKEASADGEITPKQKAMEGLYDWMERHLVGAPIAREFRDIVTTFVVKSATIHNLNNKSLAMAMVNEACIAVATSPLFMIQR
jgi:hypothetical protein